MSDYVRVRYKATGKYAVLKMTVDGGMNPEFSLTDFVTDQDLNKSLEFYVSDRSGPPFFSVSDRLFPCCSARRSSTRTKTR